MTDVTREEFDQLRARHDKLDESHTRTRERVASSETVQAQHGGAIQRLSNQIAELARDHRVGLAALTRHQDAISAQITEANSGRAKAVTAAITGGGAVGGSVAVGLYQLIHTLYPHFFGG